MPDPLKIYERHVPTGLCWAPFAVLLLFFVGVGAFGTWLSETGQGGLAAYSQRVSAELGGQIPGWVVASTLTGFGLLLALAVLEGYPAWLRRRYGRCEIGAQVLSFRLPTLLSLPGGNHGPLERSVDRLGLVWTTTPSGVLVHVPGRSWLRQRLEPLLIPVSPTEAEALVAWLETGENPAPSA